jgi:ribosomal protein S13
MTKNKIFGLKNLRSNILLEQLAFNFRFREKMRGKTYNLKESQSSILQRELSKILLSRKKKIGQFLVKFNSDTLKFLVANKSYRGNRHEYRFPVRGQRTHTNAKTAKKRLAVSLKQPKVNKNKDKKRKKSRGVTTVTTIIKLGGKKNKNGKK